MADDDNLETAHLPDGADQLFDLVEQAVQDGIAKQKEKEIEPKKPHEAQDTFLETVKENWSYSTWENYEYSIPSFIEWTEEADIDYLHELSGSDLADYKSWIKANRDRGIVSLNGLLSCLRVFLQYCAQIDAVHSDLPAKTPVPNVPDEKEINKEKPSGEQIEKIDEFLETHEPCSRRHIEYKLATRIPLRVGAIRSIDRDDVHLDKQIIKLQHRPELDFEDERGTPLKNGKDSERHVNIPDDVVGLLRRYINSPKRDEIEDKFGREPLLVSADGTRPTCKTIRQDIYKLGRPCEFDGSCKDACKTPDCQGNKNNHASECNYNYSPHPFRRWGIENLIDKHVPKPIISDRADVSVPTLNKHYDTRSKERKQKQRKNILEKLIDGYGDPDATLHIDGLEEVLLSNDGEIDKQAIVQLVDDQHDDEDNDDAEDSAAPDSQTDLTQFTGVIPYPGALFAIWLLAVVNWIFNRFVFELQDMTPDTEPSQPPGIERVAKGAAAYSLFVSLVGLNLRLLGAVPL